MTAGDDPPPSPKPPLTRPSQAWLAEQAAKRAAYAEARRRHTETWFRRLQGLADEPDPPEEALDAGPAASASADSPRQAAKRERASRARGVIHDPRQSKLGLDK